MHRPSLRRLFSALAVSSAALWAAPALASAVSVGYAGAAGDQLTAAFSVTQLAHFEAGDFTFRYDLALLSLQSVALGGLTVGFDILAGPAVPQAGGSLGEVLVSLITGGAPVDGDGTLFTAVFELIASTGAAPATLDLRFDAAPYGYALDNQNLLVTNNGGATVPEPGSAALVLAALLAALLTARLAARARPGAKAEAQPAASGV
jgi:hypothetical protein